MNPDLSQPIIAIPVLFLGGVLTSLNPCIYPMIPITAAIVGGQEVGGVKGPDARSRWRPVLLTLTYVLGLAALYSILGVIAGMTGTLFGAVSTNPWLYFTMANLLVLSALMMFEVVPVPVPASWVARASRAGTAGRFTGAFVMGAVSGLVAAPCGAPSIAPSRAAAPAAQRQTSLMWRAPGRTRVARRHPRRFAGRRSMGPGPSPAVYQRSAGTM